MTARRGPFAPNRLARTGWTAADWTALDDLLALDGYRVEHCAHDDRYREGDPDKHPSCLIVPDEAQGP